MSTPGTNPAIPTAAQLAETRLKQWHQQGEALLTLENLRSWINAAGLVLFTPRPQIASPAPSLVEAVLGSPNATPTLEQTSEARSLLARLVAEGLAVPLNLLGTQVTGGETPDFVASTAVFSYVFTLRGDKAWKQAPATQGALKVSPLAAAAHEALIRRGALSVYDLTGELGKEVTEAAVLRALGELWTHLRVLPLAQPDGGATLWELAGARLTKQIKAGANAGQPSALSALISLYLGQAVVASEEEIESFLSPLAARSRIRDVVHALLAARQLETVAVEGRTMLHVTGELPAFLAPEPVVDGVEVPVDIAAAEEPGSADADAEAAPRITKYVPKPRKIGTGYLAKASPAKFAGKPFAAKSATPRPGFKPGFNAGGGFKPRTGAGPAPDRERRPFRKPAAGGFDKPWDEAKAARPRPSEGGFQPAFRGKPSFGDKARTEPRPPRREFTPRSEGDGAARPPRKTFSKPGTFARKRERSAGKPSFGGASSSDARPPRREFSGERGERPSFGGKRAPGSFTPRPASPRPGGDRPPRPSGGGFAPRKPFAGRPPGGSSKDGLGRRSKDTGERGSLTESGKRVYRKFDAPRDRPARTGFSDRPPRPARAEFSERSDRPARPAGTGKPGGFGKKSFAKPGPGFAGKKPFAKPGGGGFKGKPDSTFAKFADGKKPFGKRPPARKFKPKKDESA